VLGVGAVRAAEQSSLRKWGDGAAGNADIGSAAVYTPEKRRKAVGGLD